MKRKEEQKEKESARRIGKRNGKRKGRNRTSLAILPNDEGRLLRVGALDGSLSVGAEPAQALKASVQPIGGGVDLAG